MNRRSTLKIHLGATAIAMLTISAFFTFSLIAEVSGYVSFIKTVKRSILYALPIMLIAMPALAFTGKQLAGNSKHPKVIEKMNRMKFIMLNGLILIAHAIYLYYHAHYQVIDNTFMMIQFSELFFGGLNLTLIGLNIRAGMLLSGRLSKA